MLPVVVVWLASLLTASASSEETDPSRREDAFRQSLGLGGKPMIHRHAPMPGGVTIWAWEDGARIVRLITDFEIETTLKLFDYFRNRAVALGGVSVDDEEEEILADPETSTFAYLDSFNRVHAVMVFEKDQMVELAGLGANSQIESKTVRSRVYQFLRDHEADDLDDQDARALWFDRFAMASGLLEAMDQVDQHVDEQGFDLVSRSPFFDDIEARSGGDVRRYVWSYYQLKEAVQNLSDRTKHARHVIHMNPVSPEFFQELQESGHLDNVLDRLDVEEDLIREALTGTGPDAKRALEELGRRGFHPRDEQDRMLQYMHEDLETDGTLEALDDAADVEAQQMSDILLYHSMDSLHPGRHDRLKFQVVSNGASSVDYAVLDDLVYRISDTWPWIDPSWDAHGEGARDPVRHPGFVRALEGSQYFETLMDLYTADASEIVWEWPGPSSDAYIEARALLGTLDVDPRMDLGDFLILSYRHGLLTPSQVDYWHAFLSTRFPNVPPPLAIPR